MKRSLAYLPEHKCEELNLIRRIILEEHPDVQMIILFGSYARDTWVEDTRLEGHVLHEYISDFDILVITEHKKNANNHAAQSRVDNLIYDRKQIRTPVSIIYHNIGQVNARLAEGRYFFTDVKKEGLLLGETETRAQARVRPAQKKTDRRGGFQAPVQRGKGPLRAF